MTRPDATAPRVAMVMEETLGHRSHADNLRALLTRSGRIDPCWVPLEFEPRPPWDRVVGYRSNWSVRSGVDAALAVARLRRSTTLDAVFFHTQVPAVLGRLAVGSLPYVVSIDATPLQYDELGGAYQHERSGERVEGLKWRANRRSFDRASTIVAWSRWARDGVVDGYGIPAERIVVIPPGVRVPLWAPSEGSGEGRAGRSEGPVRVLFVGGDFERKGGSGLLAAFRRLRAELDAEPGAPEVRLDVVTAAALPPEPGVDVHLGLTPNSAGIRSVFARADVFCLPTSGDCLPMVLSEAGASGLPSVATDVAAIGEVVRHGETGLLVPPGDPEALLVALRTLVTSPDLRRRMGAAAAELVGREFDAEVNARRLEDVLAGSVRPGRVAGEARDGVGSAR